MDEPIEALRRLRTLAAGYVAGSVTLGNFVLGMEREIYFIHPFGPYDWQVEHSPPPLDAALEAEVSFYIEWSHKHRDEPYRRSDWVYGSGSGAYGWLNEERYHADFSEALRQMQLGPLPE